ncbi:MAG: alpha/beta fold hydrolase [Thermodesulfovibrionales bacterium]
MKLDIASYHGSIDKPAIVFIHGLGMDKNIWVNPSESRILGGMFPLKILLDKKNTVENVEKIQTLFDDLRQRDYSVITWSQRRPAGPIDSAVKELHEIIIEAQKMTNAGIILIGHSRGGLIARKYLFKPDKSIKGLITISTPHKGSSVAKIAKYISPLVSLLHPFIPAGNKGRPAFAIKRIFEFLKSTSLKELLPDSSFFKSIKDGPLNGVHYASVGGTKPTLFNLYNISFPDIFEKVIPENLYPEEMRMGKGDGLVSAESSKIPWSHEHYNFAFNHAEILFDNRVRDVLGKIIERLI